MEVDFGRTAPDYAEHRAGFPPELLDRLASFGIGTPGQRVVDVGTGTGTLARLFSQRGCRVVGVDPAASLLDQARRLDAAAGVTVDHRIATAEGTGLEDGAVDVYTAGQCWHWFDRPAAAAEARRVLCPGGHLVICHFDWLPLPGTVVEATEGLIRRHNHKWDMYGSTGMYPAWTRDVAGAGFADMETFSFDVSVSYSHAGWLGRVRASAGVGGSLPDEAVRRFNDDLAAALRGFGDPLDAPHRVWAVVARA